MPDVVRLVEVGAHVLEVVVRLERRDVRRVQVVLPHVTREDASQRPLRQRVQRGELEAHAVLVADRLGAALVAGEVIRHLPEDLGPLLHHAIRDLEDPIQVVGVLHQVDEAPQRPYEGEAFSQGVWTTRHELPKVVQGLHHVPPCCK